jgi:hypothetical protein
MGARSAGHPLVRDCDPDRDRDRDRDCDPDRDCDHDPILPGSIGRGLLAPETPRKKLYACGRAPTFAVEARGGRARSSVVRCPALCSALL